MRRWWLPALVGVLLLGGCRSTDSETTAVRVVPEAIGGESCAVCGMTVREEPAPRGQVLHRDGTREHLCSLGDLRADLEVRSPHGEAIGVWVEDLPADFDLDHPPSPLDALPWIPAESAFYVVGFDRARIMGRAVLSFSRAPVADAVAKRVSGHVVSWSALRETPSHLVPPLPADGHRDAPAAAGG